jgi:predicted RNA methylase
MKPIADFGSGKGKMVFLAARYPFKRVIGIEISKPLHDIAQKNIRNTQKSFACENIHLVNMDVLDYEIPEDLTIAYFFNPFVNDIFIRVIDNIHQSFLQTPRPIWIVYKNPKMRHHLDTCDWLDFRGIHHNIAFYRTQT